MHVVAGLEAAARRALVGVTAGSPQQVRPLVRGPVMQHVALAAPVFIAGSLKVGYDLALYRSFRHIRLAEERSAAIVT